jgi:hypothetical protein
MDLSSYHARTRQRPTPLLFPALSILLVVSCPHFVTAAKLAQSSRFERKEERLTLATLHITNRCPQPHRYRVSSDIRDPRFTQQTDAILVGANSTQTIEVVCDASGAKRNLKGLVECLDCKRQEGCSQSRAEVPIQLTAVETTPLKREGRPVSTRFSSGVLSQSGANDVGVIPQGSAGCPVGSDHIYISMDDEDIYNISSVNGWTGDITHYSTGTTFGFCRVDGNQFHNHLENNYAVLQLGSSCPTGSVTIERLFDNENDSNNNWASGDIGPNTVFYDQALSGQFDTKMHFCFFFANGISGAPFPNLYVPYGVFAAPSAAWFATGTAFTDDEDDSTNLDATTPSNTLAAQSFANIVYGSDSPPFGGRNTNLLVAKVADNIACNNPCPSIGSYDGANCWMGQPPPGTTAFIWSTNFYYTPVCGADKCPLQGSSYDGANCFVTAIPPGTSAFIWSNMWYIEPVCRP